MKFLIPPALFGHWRLMTMRKVGVHGEPFQTGQPINFHPKLKHSGACDRMAEQSNLLHN
jgi:hypothetical protein